MSERFFTRGPGPRSEDLVLRTSVLHPRRPSVNFYSPPPGVAPKKQLFQKAKRRKMRCFLVNASKLHINRVTRRKDSKTSASEQQKKEEQSKAAALAAGAKTQKSLEKADAAREGAGGEDTVDLEMEMEIADGELSPGTSEGEPLSGRRKKKLNEQAERMASTMSELWKPVQEEMAADMP